MFESILSARIPWDLAEEAEIELSAEVPDLLVSYALPMPIVLGLVMAILLGVLLCLSS